MFDVEQKWFKIVFFIIWGICFVGAFFLAYLIVRALLKYIGS